ncbi:unnamed protein product [Phytophthora lilii]|uniref:Unnamed protein product n=1 Tax=Phytophthora lilii TaxID=2077276 RepID=A0A9W6WZE6_9STRA|nr:unnamed protein product [Phytophthora lilii]
MWWYLVVIFDALDFDGTEQISMDEMVRRRISLLHFYENVNINLFILQTIAFLCCTRGLCVMAGVGTVPTDEELETITLQAYRDLNKGSTQSITKSEFTKWVLEFASGIGAPFTREVTLKNALEQFRMVPPVDNTEEKAENNEPRHVEQFNEVDKIHADFSPQQDDDAENTVGVSLEQERTFEEETIKAQDSAETEYATGTTNGLLPVDGGSLSNGSEQVEMETDMQETHVDGEEALIQREPYDETGDTQETTLENVQDYHVANDSYDPGIEPQYYHEGTTNSESDYPTFVADTDESHQESDAPLNNEQDLNHEQPTQLYAEPTAHEELAATDTPQEPTTAAEFDNDDLLYEQDEFAQETPRTERDTGTDPVDSPDGKVEELFPSEQNAQAEPALVEPAVEMVLDPVALEIDPEVSTAHGLVANENVADANDTLAPEDQESTEVIASPENAPAEEKVDEPTSAVAEEPSSVDLNAYDTYDYQQAQYDGSSGLPPPEPQELLEDSPAIAVDGSADVGESTEASAK